MITLGIDPGYERLGIAVVEKDSKEKLLYSDCFKTKSSIPHHERLHLIGSELEKIIKKFKPNNLAIETLFLTSNHKTVMTVSEARGVMLYTASKNGLEVFEYGPGQIKVAVTGNGRADKNSVIKMIPLLIKVDKDIKHDDEYDAIAVALTHIACNPQP